MTWYYNVGGCINVAFKKGDLVFKSMITVADFEYQHQNTYILLQIEAKVLSKPHFEKTHLVTGHCKTEKSKSSRISPLIFMIGHFPDTDPSWIHF